MKSVFQTLTSISKWMDSHGGESRGIHRYLPEERADTNVTRQIISIIGLWISGCGGLTSMSSFFLGPLLLGLGYKDTMVVGILGTFTGCLVAAYLSTMGPRSGLRQICSTRYLFGPYLVRVVSVITIVGFLGWNVTNSVLGGQILSQINGNGLSVSLGIVIVCLVSLAVAIFGIRYVLMFESAMGILVILVVVLLYVVSDNRITQYHDLQTLPGSDEITKIGARITFFNLTYSVTVTWGGCAADYYVLLPETVSQTTVFLVTLLGTAVPTIFVAVSGILIGNAAVGYAPWGEAYTDYSLGGLLNVVLSRWNGFGKFLLVILWISLITNNILNNYSSALNVQLVDQFFFKYFPRWFIVVLIFVVTIVCSLAGRDSFSLILSNFLPMLGYWISIYFTILLEENAIFRSTRLVKLFRYELYGGDPRAKSQSDKSKEITPQPRQDGAPPYATTKSAPYYNFTVWNDSAYHTYGIAATLASFSGVAGAIVGMNQVYYIGPIARLVGDDAADLGTYIAIVFAGVVYPVARYLELKKFGK